MKKLFIIVACVGALAVVGCGGKDSPENFGKKYIEKKIEVTDKWNVYAGECNAYKDILEKLNKLMKYV